MAANGYIPASWLKALPGSNAGLLKPLAYQYWALHYDSVKRYGVSMQLIDGSIGRAYRSYARQVIARNYWCAQGKCGNAAWPGTSNHGLGINVDLMSYAQRSSIDKIGAKYGFSKAWSDASWEWWHITGRNVPGYDKQKKPDPLKGLSKKERKLVNLYHYHVKERNREAPSGKGRRWKRHNKWANYYFDRIRKQQSALQRAARKPIRRGGGWKKHHRGQRYQILGRVLNS